MKKCNKVFLISNADSTFTKGYIKNVLRKQYDKEVEIYMATGSNKLFGDFYDEFGVDVNVMYKNKTLSKIPFIRTLEYIFNILKEIKRVKPDLIIVNYAFAYLMYFLSKLKINTPIVLVYWGSDLFRISKFQRIISKSMVKKADKIVVLTEEMKKTFEDFYGAQATDKLRIIDFGVSSFEYIDKARKNIKNTFFYDKFPSNKTILTLGYNSRVEQQHKMVLSWLNHYSKKNDLFIVIPATYPSGNEKYIDTVEKYLKENNYDYYIIKDFMDETQISSLCVLTNIFVHAQTTDSISTSMLEHLYSGNVVFNGSWLKYSFLDSNRIEYYQFTEEKDFLELLSDIHKDCKKKNMNNREILKDKCGWDTCYEKWSTLFKDIK